MEIESNVEAFVGAESGGKEQGYQNFPKNIICYLEACFLYSIQTHAQSYARDASSRHEVCSQIGWWNSKGGDDMYPESNPGPVVTHRSLREYFHGELNDALKNQRINAEHETVHYLTNLLTVFTRSEALFDHTENGVQLKPLALTYGEALNENRTAERTRLLQKLGDTALFIAGVFADSLKTRLVDVDYYIAMGGSAYSSLSDSMRGYRAVSGAAFLFEELTHKFTDFVDVLNEVSERSRLADDRDVLRTYELWLRTGSKRARTQLRRLGIEPLACGSGEFHQ
jgi:hypothetical protein